MRMLVFKLFTILVLLANQQVFSSCPPDWTTEKSSCYLYVSKEKKWKNAAKHCQAIHHGSHLMNIDNSLQSKNIRSLVLRILKVDSSDLPITVFVGATKTVYWYWENGVKVSRTVDESSVSIYLGMTIERNSPGVTFTGFDHKYKKSFICEISTGGLSISASSTLSLISLKTSILSSERTNPTSTLGASPSIGSTPLLTRSTSPPINQLPTVTFKASPSIGSTPLLTRSTSPPINQLPTATFKASQSINSMFSTRPASITELKNSATKSKGFTSPSTMNLKGSDPTVSPTKETSGTRKESFKSNSSQPIEDFTRDLQKLDVKDSSSINKSIHLMEKLISSSPRTLTKNGMDIMTACKSFEEFALKYYSYHLNTSEYVVNSMALVLKAEKMFFGDKDYNMALEPGKINKFAFSLPNENFAVNGTTIVSVYYNNLESLLPNISTGQNKQSYELKSKIVSISISPSRKTLAKNITFLLATQNMSKRLDYKRMCVFWQYVVRDQHLPGWSDDGCTVVKTTDNYVECSCNHLTHFGILMQVNDLEIRNSHVDILTIITKIGLTLSIIGCILTFLAYYYLTDTKSEQSRIRMGLVATLASAHVLFLFSSSARIHIVICVGVAGMTQYFYTSALCWMFVEGIQLYLQIVRVFNSNVIRMKQVYGFTLGVPALLIICSLSIAGNNSEGLASFVGETQCWLSLHNHLVWFFVGPVLLVILGNLVILGLVFKEMVLKNVPASINNNEHRTRSGIKALFVLAPILGVTWLVGLLSIVGVGLVGSYIFTILNSVQGFLIFIFHCWKNSEIQSKFRRRIYALEATHGKHKDSFRGSTNVHPKLSNKDNVLHSTDIPLDQQTIRTNTRFDAITVDDI